MQLLPASQFNLRKPTLRRPGDGHVPQCRTCTTEAHRQLNLRRIAINTADTGSMIAKQCPGCKALLPAGAFNVEKSSVDGLQDKCRTCKTNYAKQRRETNGEALRARDRRYNAQSHRRLIRAKEVKSRRDRALALCGGAICKCCKETTDEFLTIDHIHNDGSKHRASINSKGGNSIHLWILRNPSKVPGYLQVLCMNCQWGKRDNKTCPHQAKENLL